MELTVVANFTSNLLVLLFKSLCRDIDNFLSSVRFFFQTFPKFISTNWNHFWRKSQISNCNPDEPLLNHLTCPENEITGESEKRICTGEINTIMNRLGIGYALEDNGKNQSFGVEDFLGMFDEEEPSLEEIKETFGVFDVNKDGFIDAGDLQGVVCSISLNRGFGLEECQRMIRAFDVNGDGRIDFHEFVKFMEKCL